jgi:uncharacterized membrane protein YpjA
MKLAPYVKSIVATAGAVLVAVQVAIEDGAITSQEWVLIATGFVTAVGVYFFPNKDGT